jgi:hypothetical protein
METNQNKGVYVNWEKVDTATFAVYFDSNLKIGEFVRLEDGFWNFLPQPLMGGVYPEYILYDLADALKGLNKDASDELDKRLFDYPPE